MTKPIRLIAPALCCVLAGIVLAADPPKQDAGKKDPVVVTGYLDKPKRIGAGPIYIDIPNDPQPTKLPLIIDNLKDWTAEKFLKAEHVRATGTLQVRPIEVRPGVKEELLALVATSMEMIERQPNPPPRFPQPLDLPQGVTHIALPPGRVTLENLVSKKGKPILRLTAGEMTIDTERLFLGDGRIATEFDVSKEGMHWRSTTGGNGWLLDGEMNWEPGSTIDLTTDYIPLGQLKPGSLYVSTPSIKFEFKPKPDAKR